MKKLLLAALLSVVSVPAFAMWTEVSSFNGVEIYLDLETINRQDDIVQVVVLQNYTSVKRFANLYDVLSAEAFAEYDCKNIQTRNASLILYQGNMGTGKTLFVSTRQGPWHSIIAGSIGKDAFDVACMKVSNE